MGRTNLCKIKFHIQDLYAYNFYLNNLRIIL